MAGRSGRQAVAELAERGIIPAPGPAHLDPQVEVDGDAEERLELAPRRLADALEHGAALADDDGLLGRLLHEDDRPGVEAPALALGQLLHPHGGRVGDLL